MKKVTVVLGRGQIRPYEGVIKNGKITAVVLGRGQIRPYEGVSKKMGNPKRCLRSWSD